MLLYFVCGIGMGQGRQRAAAAAPPRDRSLGITDEECSERTYIIGHIYADRVRTVSGLGVFEGRSENCVRGSPHSQSI